MMGRLFKSEPPGEVSLEVVFLSATGKELVRQGPYKAEIDALAAVKELLPSAVTAKSWEIRRITRSVVQRGEVIIHH